MTERIAVITGATHGIGVHTARTIAEAGFRLVLACRDTVRAAQVRQTLLTGKSNLDIEVMRLDLASLASVRAFAAAFASRYDRLDLLVNNAGMVGYEQARSVDGYELTFATNHLGPFLLTNLLLPQVRKAPPGARIVVVASTAHYGGHLDFDDLQHDRRRYRIMQVYYDSKLANVLFSFALARRLADTGITVNCLHPGFVGSNLFPQRNPLLRWLGAVIKLFALSEERGAQTSIKLALSPAVATTTGLYFDEHGKPKEPSIEASDLLVQERLWTESARLVGIDAA